jgi:hypothetical protein
MSGERNDVYPGLNSLLKLDHFKDDEKKIIYKLSKEWYITNGGWEFIMGLKSKYRFVLIKPIKIFQEMFNLEREIIVIFSPFGRFEPRTLDAIDYVLQKHQVLRLEKICNVIISKDDAVEDKLREILTNEKESQVVIPFSYTELINNKDSFFIRNRFKKYFYTRDLFAFEAPLKKDLYFFGRNDFINRIVSRHKSNENSGIFGLRKTGKTSLIFGVQRTLSKIDEKSVFIDCQNPSFHMRRWNKALYYIIKEIINQNDLDFKLKDEELYIEENASYIFEEEIFRIYEFWGKKNILIIFDEIENITFNISPSEHWAKGLDFIFFWQTLRSVFQKLNRVFTFLIVGTNPLCIEVPSIEGKDNPIFNQIPFEYIPCFDVQQTREMVRKLSKIMGMRFDEIIYSKLTEDFGGHPFLIRHVCSIINRISSPERPTDVNKLIYENAKEIFEKEYSNYFEMILHVLFRFYCDEYEMLKYLAIGDYQRFYDYNKISSNYTNHLIGYGIIDEHNEGHSFKIETVKDFLLNRHKYAKLDTTPEERLKEISERRNQIEPKLRQIIRTQLIAQYGMASAKEIVLNIMGGYRKQRYSVSSYNDLFNPNKSNIYFDDLRKIIIKYWNTTFKNIFDADKHEFDSMMKTINKYRNDAHAKEITNQEMEFYRVCISNVEQKVNDFLS